ncbi:response regulator [Rhizorhapis suberifaciens]|uniref:CheY-like chemotaxis protein n=1 Tax=Rhizorhapis suberifaciens TaxID=13656 RepID=A0A840HQ98_9SPHN|nr:response regulator [Rhizorhapis suberifaciens]MBB4639891.1 CheY-like chemotaxis protein [Rhizorhapis suberifaciens]
MTMPEPLRGLRLFVVEDEALVAMLLEQMLEDLGCEVVSLAGTVGQALDQVEKVAPRVDAAILDVNLGGERVYPVADALAAHDIPFLFATGYGPSGLDDRYPDSTVLSKPYVEATLVNALLQVRAG